MRWLSVLRLTAAIFATMSAASPIAPRAIPDIDQLIEDPYGLNKRNVPDFHHAPVNGPRKPLKRNVRDDSWEVDASFELGKSTLNNADGEKPDPIDLERRISNIDEVVAERLGPGKRALTIRAAHDIDGEVPDPVDLERRALAVEAAYV